MTEQQQNRDGFDANARAARRESGDVTVGDVVYRPARLTNKALRDIRRLARRAGNEARKAGRESEEYQETYDYAVADGVAEEEARKLAEEAGANSEAVALINNASLTQQLQILLRTPEGEQVDADQIHRSLEEDMDARDVSGLMAYLLGDDEDPT